MISKIISFSKTAQKKTMRDSKFELLRIISILLIISFHCTFEGGFEYPEFCLNKYIVECFHMFGELGVNLFILISGYHMIHGKFKWSKLINLLLTIQFYNWLHVFVSIRLGILTLDTKTVFTNFFPVLEYKYWFATAYILIYILSPYINLFLKSLNKKQYQSFMGISLLLFCVIPTFYGVLKNNTEDLLYCNRFIWLLVVYMAGAYLRLHPFSKSHSFLQYSGAFGAAMLFLFASVYVLEKLQPVVQRIGIYNGDYFWHPNALPLAFASVCLFLAFSVLTIRPSFLINFIASTTFGIYLFHDGQLNLYIWGRIFQTPNYTFSKYLFFHILVWSAVIFLSGIVLECVRKAVFAIAHFIISFTEKEVQAEIHNLQKVNPKRIAS